MNTLHRFLAGFRKYFPPFLVSLKTGFAKACPELVEWGDMDVNIVELSRHTGRDCRYPEHREVNLACPPWRLGSGNPCRNDEQKPVSTALKLGDYFSEFDLGCRLTDAAVYACIVTLLFTVVAWADSATNELDTQGRGGGNTVYTDQSNGTGGNLIDIYQVGGSTDGSDATRNYAGTSTSRIVQTGSDNVARIGQGAIFESTLSDTGGWGGSGTWAAGTTTPVQSNTAVINQSGDGQRAEIYQTGSGNTAMVIQSGSAAVALLAAQAGVANILNATQTATGSGLVANIQQNGGGTINLNQSGDHSLISVSNMTGGTANLTQEGIGGPGTPGSNNTMTISGQTADSGTVTLTQKGSGNTFSVTNPIIPGLTITQTH